MRKSKGFTLIELIIYVALVSIFISGAILFAWDIIYGRVKSGVHQEVSQNLGLVSRRLAFELRRAEGINSMGGSSISLQMEDSARDPTVFEVIGDRLMIGFGGSGPCPVSAPCSLTGNRVRVTDLTLADFSIEDSTNVQFSLTVESLNPSGRKEWERSETQTTAVELRSHN